jgi:hypothetical protein
LAAKALNMLSIFEATHRHGAPEDVVSFITSQLSTDMAAWTPPEESAKKLTLAAVSGGGGQRTCAYCRKPGHGYERCRDREANIAAGKPHPPHWKEHYHTESAH